MVQETIKKIIQIKQRMQAARDQQKSYADLKRKPIEFQVGVKVMLKVSPWKGVVRFGKRGKLNPRFVGPFKVLEKVGAVAYKAVSYSRAKQGSQYVSHIQLEEVRGPEFTWEREDQFRKKYPHRFAKTAPSSRGQLRARDSRIHDCEQEVKKSEILTQIKSQNVAFVSTPDSSNEDNIVNVQVNTTSTNVSTASSTDNTARLSDATIYAFLVNQPNGSQVVHEDLEQIREDDLEEMDLKWQLALLSLKERKFYQRSGKKIIINESDTAGYDKSKVECFNCHKMGHFARECRGPRNQESRPRNQESRPRSQDSSRRTVNVEESSSKAMLAIDGVGFDWSFMTEEEIPTNFALMAFSDSEIERLKKEKESNQIKIDNFENASKSLDKLIGCQISDNNRKGVGYNAVAPPPTGLFAPPTIDLSNSKTSGAPIIEDWVSDCDEDETLEKVSESTNVQKPKQADQPRKISQNPRNNSTNWNTPMSKKLGVGFQFTPKACFVCGSFNHLIKDCDFHDKRCVIFAPTSVLTKSGLVPISTARQSSSRAAAPVSTARPIKTAAPKPFVNVVKSRPNAFQKISKIDCLLSSEVLFEGRLMMSDIALQLVMRLSIRSWGEQNGKVCHSTSFLANAEHDMWSQVSSYHIGDVDAQTRFEAASKRPIASSLKRLHTWEVGRQYETNGELMEFFDQERKEANDIDWSKIVEQAQKRQSDPSQEQSTEEPKELSKEDLKEMLEIVPVEETKAEALQVKYPIVDWEVHTEGSRKY
ncbi:ribonuclease H-like domain-containing protein [Tanacetum coccineum]